MFNDFVQVMSNNMHNEKLSDLLNSRSNKTKKRKCPEEEKGKNIKWIISKRIKCGGTLGTTTTLLLQLESKPAPKYEI